MKKITNNILYGALCLTLVPCSSVFAQQVIPTDNKPDPVTETPVTVPYPGIQDLNNTGSFNYIRTIIPDAPFQTIPGNSNYYFRMGTEFYDGLGRPMQTVSRKAHADGNDLVTVKVYDAIGNESYHYPPYAAPTSGIYYSGFIGGIKINENSQLRNFYDHNGPDEQPYSQTVFDNSPLNRITKSMAPGRSWVGSGRGKEYVYKTNPDPRYNQSSTVIYVTTGNFPRFTIGNNNTDLPVYSGNYSEGQLYINKTKDEDGKVIEEIKDKDGRVIMKRSLLSTNKEATYPTSGPTDIFPNNYTYTHYVYNDLGQLRAIIPPAAIQPFMSNYGTTTGTVTTNTYTYTWPSPTLAQVNGLCYTYFYDELGRLVEKKTPGKDLEYYVYDKRDRQIFYQDGNMKPNNWIFTIYDVLDRPIQTGSANWGNVTRTYIQGLVNNTTTYPTNDVLYYVKNYSLYHTYPPTLLGCTVLSYTYYDDYSQLTGLGFDASQFAAITLPSDNTVVPSVLTNSAKGLTTWSQIRVLDAENPTLEKWLSSVNYYDINGRVIQTVSQNLLGGTDISSNVYYFQGMLYKNILKHVNPGAKAIPGTTDPVINQYTIENTFQRNLKIGGGNDQVWKRTQKINDGPEYELSFYAYDHMERNTWKQWTTGFNQKDYNMTGAVNHIAFRKYNNDTAFIENLYYSKGFKSKLFNGNVAGITWSGADHKKRAYGYSYDNLNRLTHAEFNQFDVNTSAWDKLEGVDFTASNISYDLNGNIKSMNQMGRVPLASSSIPMDILTYTYTPNSNQLSNVKDAVNSSTTAGLPDFKDDLSNNPITATEYHYDNNGNMDIDVNKSISSIKYNYLNKPEKIVVDGKGTITYVYDAAGNKLRKKTVDAVTGAKETWDYFGGIVYKDSVLQYILNEEGRARPIVASNNEYPTVPAGEHWTKFVYDYFVKDHIGNTRSTVTSKPNAYPYLAMHNISTANIEELIFDNIPNVRDTKPGSTNPDDMAARLNGGELDKRVGTAIMLRTNPGDRFTINVNAFYDGEYEQTDEQIPAEEMISSLMGTLLGGSTIGRDPLPVEGLPDNQAIITNIFSDPSLPQQLEHLMAQNNNTSAPKAHLNYLWFNDKMQFQAANSGSVQVVQAPGWNVVAPVGGTNGGWGTTTDPGISSPGVGFLVVYIDNQSIGKDVWFDNLSLNNYTSDVLEEDHYYPFGLTVNTTPANQPNTANPYKLTTKELESKFGINSYDFGARQFDMTLGRWTGSDPLCENYSDVSPYVYCGNNPVGLVDLNGESTQDATVSTQMDKSRRLNVKSSRANTTSSTKKVNGAEVTTTTTTNVTATNVVSPDNEKMTRKGDVITTTTTTVITKKDGKTSKSTSSQTTSVEQGKSNEDLTALNNATTFLEKFRDENGKQYNESLFEQAKKLSVAFEGAFAPFPGVPESNLTKFVGIGGIKYGADKLSDKIQGIIFPSNSIIVLPAVITGVGKPANFGNREYRNEPSEGVKKVQQFLYDWTIGLFD